MLFGPKHKDCTEEKPLRTDLKIFSFPFIAHFLLSFSPSPPFSFPFKHASFSLPFRTGSRGFKLTSFQNIENVCWEAFNYIASNKSRPTRIPSMPSQHMTLLCRIKSKGIIAALSE